MAMIDWGHAMEVMSREIRPIKDPGNVLEILEAGCERGPGQGASSRRRVAFNRYR
jgi:hypothetical protein